VVCDLIGRGARQFSMAGSSSSAIPLPYWNFLVFAWPFFVRPAGHHSDIVSKDQLGHALIVHFVSNDRLTSLFLIALFSSSGWSKALCYVNAGAYLVSAFFIVLISLKPKIKLITPPEIIFHEVVDGCVSCGSTNTRRIIFLWPF